RTRTRELLPEGINEAFDVADGDREFWVPDEPERVEPADGRAEAHEHPAVVIGRKGEPTVGDGQARGPRGLDEVVWARDRDGLDVAKRRGHAPGPKSSVEGPVADSDPRGLSRDAENGRQETKRRRERELKSPHRRLCAFPPACAQNCARGVVT